MTNKYLDALEILNDQYIVVQTGSTTVNNRIREAIREALTEAAKVEAGTHVVVPVECTDEMINAALHPSKIVDMWEAMIQAAKDTQS